MFYDCLSFLFPHERVIPLYNAFFNMGAWGCVCCGKTRKQEALQLNTCPRKWRLELVYPFIQQIFIAHLLCAKPCYQAVCSGNKIGMGPAHGMCHLVMLRSTMFLCSSPAFGDEQGQTSRNNALLPLRLFPKHLSGELGKAVHTMYKKELLFERSLLLQSCLWDSSIAFFI